MSSANHHTLDNPAWSALGSKHSHLRQGGEFARRYHPTVSPFAALASHTPAAFQELHQLLGPDEQVALQTLGLLEPTGSLLAEHGGLLHQMIALQPVGGILDDKDVLPFSVTDAADMLHLAEKTKPGPFRTETYKTGRYIGIRDQGQLIAMAGERMRLDGYVEISAVCVDENYRGKGIAARLMQILRKDIEQRGDIPFLHVFDTNHSAIRLYEHLGFELRQVFQLYRIKRTD